MRKIHNAGGVTQGAPNPTYLKQNGDMASFAVGMGLITFALLKVSVCGGGEGRGGEGVRVGVPCGVCCC